MTLERFKQSAQVLTFVVGESAKAEKPPGIHASGATHAVAKWWRQAGQDIPQVCVPYAEVFIVFVDAEQRWDAITRLALGDTMFETTVMLVMEGWNPEEEQRIEFFEWIWPKIIRGADKLEAYCKRGFNEFDIGQASMLHAISYMDFRVNFYDAKDPLYPEFNVFENRPNLEAWWKDNIQRPSVLQHYNVDFEGDDSAEFLRKNVDEVLELQREHGTL